LLASTLDASIVSVMLVVVLLPVVYLLCRPR
jgi:hypothetical protein